MLGRMSLLKSLHSFGYLDDGESIPHPAAMAAGAPNTNERNTGPRFLLLMRHFARKKMREQADEIARGLCDFIGEAKISGAALQIVKCVCPAEGHAFDSVRELRKCLGRLKRSDECPAPTPFDQLNPLGEAANPYRSRSGDKQRRKQLNELGELLNKIKTGDPAESKDAVLIVGHSPHIDWLLHELRKPAACPPRLWRLFPSYHHAFAAGEIICVDLASTPRRPLRPIWSLAPTDNETEPLLREKIRSKMESAKLLGGIVAAGIGYVVTGFHELMFGWSKSMDDAARYLRSKGPDLDDERFFIYCGCVAALLIATGLYCSAYLSYDRLLMPTRFWAATEPPKPRWRVLCAPAEFLASHYAPEHAAGLVQSVYPSHLLHGLGHSAFGMCRSYSAARR